MLWLARVYAGQSATQATMFLGWPNVVSDWAKRLREHDFERAIYSRPEPLTTLHGPHRDLRIYKSNESPRRVADLLAAQSSARGAVQGGR